MGKQLSEMTLGIIHASHLTIPTVKIYAGKYIPEVTIMHFCDDTVQRDNIAAKPGTIPKVNYYKFAQYAHNLEAAGVDLIMLVCSTFNYAAELARPLINVQIAQIDRPMMELAVKTGKKIGIMATLPTTVPSSERLLKLAAAEAGVDVEINTVVCEEAFVEFAKGNITGHNELLLNAVHGLAKKTDCVVMAQLSMSSLAPELKNTASPVYNSGDTGFARVREMLDQL